MKNNKPFLYNTWYPAAWSTEIEESELFSRTILNQRIVFWREDNGKLNAIQDRCSHRFVPLSKGKHCGNEIECPYHGLRFNSEGACTHNPHGDGTIPTNANLSAYALHEKYMLVWIWMGDPELANPDLIPAFDFMDPSSNAINSGYLTIPSHYELMTDNIMDLSHIEFIHSEILGSEAVRRAEVQSKIENNTVWSWRETENEVLPEPLQYIYGVTEPCRRTLEVRWNPPALMQLKVAVVPMDDSKDMLVTPGIHLMTPETEETTHYFWSSTRDFRLEDHELHNAIQQGLEFAFTTQDAPMVLAQQEEMAGKDFWECRPAILKTDTAAVLARRTLGKLIREENKSETLTDA